MLADARQFYDRAWWLLTFPGVSILGTVMAFNLLGDGLRDALDPKLRAVTGLLEVRGLAVAFDTARGRFNAVEGVDLDVAPGEVLCVVGESGSGKSVSMLAVMGLLPPAGRVVADRVAFRGTDLLTIGPRARRRLIGRDVAMVFQEPTSSLNPVLPDRLADRRGPARSPGGAARADPGPGGRPARPGRHPRAGTADARLPAPALRRAEPAGDDRHGHRLQPGAADRRRAHHGAGT